MKPVIQAILLADRVYTEAGSGKKIIAGTFNRIIMGQIATPVKEMPDGTEQKMILGGTDIGCPSVYLSLTDVVNGTKIAVQFTNVSKNETITGLEVVLEPTSRLAVVELVLPLPPMNMLVQEPGVYSIDVVWNGEILGFHRLIADPLNPTGA